MNLWIHGSRMAAELSSVAAESRKHGTMEIRNHGVTELGSGAADLRTHEITEQWTLKRKTTRLKRQENGKTSVIPIPVNS